MQDTQLPPPSSPHATITPAKSIIVKDVIDTSCQNINPLTTEDLSRILDQSTQQACLSTDPLLVNVDEIHKAIVDPRRVKVKIQEPPSILKATRPPLLLLPPPLPPSTTSNTMQMSSEEIGEGTRKLEQIIGTPP